MKQLITIIFVFVLGFAIAACSDGGSSTSDPNAGFKLETFAVGPGGAIIPTGGRVQGQFLQANGTTTGSVEFFSVSHGGAILLVSGARVPGRWRLTLGPDFAGASDLCLTFTTVEKNMSLNSLEQLRCPGRFFGFTASPDSLDALNPPATVTFTGEGIKNVFGEPVLAFYNEFGVVVASTQTSSSQSICGGGEIQGVTVSVPDISQVFDGIYTIVVHNVNADGSWEVIGAANVTIFGNPPPPSPPPPEEDPCYLLFQDQSQLPCDQQ